MMDEPRMMDISGSLRKLAGELIDIGVEVDEPFELVAKIGGVSFMLTWIADGLDRELQLATDRAKWLQYPRGVNL